MKQFLSGTGGKSIKPPLMKQVRRLAHQSEARVVWFCGALLTIDLFFIAVFLVHRTYAVLYPENAHTFGEKWNIGHDGSYAELFGHVKTAIIVVLLTSSWRKYRRPVYLAFIVIFTIVLLDDALQLHEQLGRGLAGALGLQQLTGRTGSAFGQLIVWTITGILLLAGMLAAFVRSYREDLSNGLLLMGALAVLGLFAVLVDLTHVLVRYHFSWGGDLLFTVIEEGGEQMTLSLICGLAVLVRRELHSRAPV